MKTPAVVAVDREPEAFARLFEAARAAGVRVGWLELDEQPAAPLPEALERACGLGAMRAVSAGGNRVVTVKPVAGAVVLRDLVRGHFLGCGLLLVRGLAGWPRLEPSGAGFELGLAADRRRVFDAADLVAELRRPRHRLPAETR